MTQERYTGWVKPRGGYWVAVVGSVDWWTCWVRLLLVPAWPGTRRMVLPYEDTPYRLARPTNEVGYEAQLDRLDAAGWKIWQTVSSGTTFEEALTRARNYAKKNPDADGSLVVRPQGEHPRGPTTIK